MQRGTTLERRIDAVAHRLLKDAPGGGLRAALIEVAVFVLKQSWACVFGATLLAAIVAARLWYPDDAIVARNDALTITAVLIQVAMLVFRLETGRELWVIVLFHITGTVMELFKTDVGSWAYAADGVLRIGAVPLFSGFMYAAVGSYMVRVHRLFDLGFTHYPRRWLTTVLAAAVYVNFFTHHWWWDARWVLLAGVVVLWLPTVMHARVWRRTLRLPLVAVFAGVAVFIYLAENIGTWAGAWAYPDQAVNWQPVSLSKLSSWFLLMIISVVMVTWVYPPRRPDIAQDDDGADAAASAPSEISQAPVTGAAPAPPAPRRRRRRRAGAGLPS
ncbi:uncharacterized membrane protein YoaT (DUF817 family) [Microbacterium natoriense]|uniref:Uncharacterized membrane protein YoaT (DUF817 family) n=1 Tax=Microbacterium natoriense TaxID=284570 RepID=A0AAW8EYF9_9MICO|nr:DUF817 domain-containing protein [Microbacterium natoriense]MDQ0647714.1 uncharacterized membrane protein YoaT (DUF817 family) [Microbacterium natoriense]